MRYQKVLDDNSILIIPEGEDVKAILLTIARLSYETATPRGMGYEQGYDAPSREVVFEKHMEYERGKPVRLVMDYIHGRDCRTMVYERDGQWFLDAYAYSQRKVTSEEFLLGIVRDKPEDFLDMVIAELRKH